MVAIRGLYINDININFRESRQPSATSSLIGSSVSGTINTHLFQNRGDTVTKYLADTVIYSYTTDTRKPDTLTDSDTDMIIYHNLNISNYYTMNIYYRITLHSYTQK